MNLKDFDIVSIVIGAAITAGLVILGSMGWDFAYPFSAAGLLYVGYKAPSIKWGTFLGAFASTPLIVLALDETYMVDGQIKISGVFGLLSPEWALPLAIIILLVGAFVGFVGAYSHSAREKAKIEYEKQQKSGKKNKNKKKK